VFNVKSSQNEWSILGAFGASVEASLGKSKGGRNEGCPTFSEGGAPFIFTDFSWSHCEGDEALGRFISASSPFLLNVEYVGQKDTLRIDLSLNAERDTYVNSILLHFDFLPNGRKVASFEELDYCRVPHFIPEPGLVIGDHVFRSPAVILRKANIAAAMVPELDVVGAIRPAQWIMDFDMKSPSGAQRISLGLMNYNPYHHVYFKKRPERSFLVPKKGVKISAYLIFSSAADDRFPRRVLKFIWQRYGVENYKAVKPQTLSLDTLGGEAMGRLFKRDDLYFEFDYGGARCAGVAAHAATSEKPLKALGPLATKFMSPIHGLFITYYLKAMNKFGLTVKTDDITRRTVHRSGIPFIAEAQFTSWFNDLRTAYGARILAERRRDKRLMEQADLIKNLALRAPEDDGIFSAVCAFPKGKVWWKKGTLAFRAIDDYHTPDQATTGYVMLRWHRDIEPDQALLEKARGLGRFFIKHQRASGTVPAWIEGRTHKPIERLLDSASTAGPMMFMALLALVDGDEQALASAKKMADFIEKEVLPEHKWYDYETFYSCSKQRTPPRDPRSGMLPQNTMSMLWATEGMRLLFELTGEARYLDFLLRCLDDLLFFQQAWDAPYISINTFGGFCCMLSDAEWNDARQGIIAPVLMDSYLATGDPEHFQRGVSALRACYTTMLSPAMRDVAPGNMVHYRESDRGAIYENYGHIGIDRVIAGYLEPDWGAGTAAFATAHALKFYGDVFVDLDRGQAFGVNGCDVTGMRKDGESVWIDVTSKVPDLESISVVVRGAAPGLKIFLNGAEKGFRNFSKK